MTRREELPPPAYGESDALSAPADPTSTILSNTREAFANPDLSQRSSITPPEDAQRAVAPLTLHETNHSIKGAYIVNVSENKLGPDIDIKSTNGSVKLAIWAEGSIPRPVNVKLNATNGSVNLAVPAKSAGQVWKIDVFSDNGSVAAAIPPNFRGKLVVSSRNGMIVLSDQVKRNSIVIPSDGGAKMTTYRISPSNKALDGLKADTDESDAQQDDQCEIKTNNGRILVQYASDAVAPGGTDSTSSRCLIA